jgi:hypothetical protein
MPLTRFDPYFRLAWFFLNFWAVVVTLGRCRHLSSTIVFRPGAVPHDGGGVNK